MKDGDTVIYIDDWQPNRKWRLESIYENLCKIVLIRDGKTVYEKNGLIHSNPSIVNLDISKIRTYGEIHINNN